MAEDWRIRECLNQLLLQFALELDGPAPGSAGWPPAPLPPLEAGGGAGVRELREQVRRGELEFAQGLDRLRRNARDPATVQKILATPPWTIGELVGWWIDAGLAVAAWRSPPEASRQALESRLRLGFELSRHLHLDDDEEYPALWCADHAVAWRLRRGRPLGRAPAWWRERAAGRDPCLERLLEWCGDPARELQDAHPADPSPEAWAADARARYRGLARGALRLLRRRCWFDRQVAGTAVADRWQELPTVRSPAGLSVVRRPLVTLGEGGQRQVAPGWLLVPWPARLVDHCLACAAAGSRARALESARAAWQPHDRSWEPIPPWSDAREPGSCGAHGGDSAPPVAASADPWLFELGTNGDGPAGSGVAAGQAPVEPLRGGTACTAEDARPARLAALARLVLAATAGDAAPPPEPDVIRDPRDLLAFALARDGFEARWADAGEPGQGRLIPWVADAADPLPGGGGRRLHLGRRGSDLEIEVGLPRRPAGHPAAVVAAIEEVDWSWWALEVLIANGCDVSAGAAAADETLRREWEPLKRRLVELAPGTPEAAAAAAAAMELVAGARRRLEAAAGLATQPATGELCGRLAALAAALFAVRLADLLRGTPGAWATVAHDLLAETERVPAHAAGEVVPLERIVNWANRLLDEELPEHVAEPVFDLLARWSALHGWRLLPSRWCPGTGGEAAELEVERAAFHPRIPGGGMIVERFGAAAADGTSVASPLVAISAGPAPAGFEQLDRCVRSIADPGDGVRRLRDYLEGLPKRVLANQDRSTIWAGLFDVAWKARLDAPERGELTSVVKAVHDLLARSFDMVIFEPERAEQYRESWLKTEDGSPPQGTRVSRVVRPGVRTRGDVLVWPAIVEME